MNDIKIIDQYMEQYPSLAQHPLVLKTKAQIAFKEAEKINTKDAWEQFILYYSNSEYEPKAKEKLSRIK